MYFPLLMISLRMFSDHYIVELVVVSAFSCHHEFPIKIIQLVKLVSILTVSKRNHIDITCVDSMSYWRRIDQYNVVLKRAGYFLIWFACFPSCAYFSSYDLFMFSIYVWVYCLRIHFLSLLMSYDLFCIMLFFHLIPFLID